VPLVRNYGNVLGERQLASVRYKACFAEVSLARQWQIINDKMTNEQWPADIPCLYLSFLICHLLFVI